MDGVGGGPPAIAPPAEGSAGCDGPGGYTAGRCVGGLTARAGDRTALLWQQHVYRLRLREQARSARRTPQRSLIADGRRATGSVPRGTIARTSIDDSRLGRVARARAIIACIYYV